MNGFIVATSRVAAITNKRGEFDLQAFVVDDGLGRVVTLLTIRCGEPRAGLLVRLNSGCVTSEVFGDDSCDCAWQLAESMELIAKTGSGLIIHSAHHEGRGAGIFEKINSMAEMREASCSSADAFRRLGLPVDSRSFAHSAILLRHLGITDVTLLSDNAAKLRALRAAGIKVRAVQPIVAAHMDNFAQYIRGKGLEFISGG